MGKVFSFQFSVFSESCVFGTERSYSIRVIRSVRGCCISKEHLQ